MDERSGGTAAAAPGYSIARRLVHGALAVGLLTGGGALAFYLLTGDQGVSQRPAAERSARLVETRPARVGPHTVTVTAWGAVRPARELPLRPRLAGRVTEVHAGLEPGALVRAGTTLVQLDREPFVIDLDRARAALTRARADLTLERGRQAVARREFELLDQPAGDAERALMLREPQLASARAAVAAAEADVADARRALADTAVTAPFDALVRDSDVTVGSEVGTGTTVTRLIGIDTWWVELALPSSRLPWITFPDEGEVSGSSVRLHHEGVWADDAHRTGRVVRLLGDLEEQGRLARVLVAVDDPLARSGKADGPRLLVGAFMRASIRGRRLDRAVAIESGWLRSGDTVWIMDADDRLAIRDVSVAYRDRDRVLISDGLVEGDRIVVSPLALPTEGMPLRRSGSAPQ